MLGSIIREYVITISSLSQTSPSLKSSIPGQLWEYQVGPCETGNHLWVSRCSGSCEGLLRSLTLWSVSIPSPLPEIGTVLAATPTSGMLWSYLGNQNSLFWSRDWLSANKGPVFTSNNYRFYVSGEELVILVTWLVISQSRASIYFQ